MDSAPVLPLSDQAAAAWALALGVGLLLNGLVFGATATVKAMLPPGYRYRRIVLPLIGFGFGLAFMTCLLILMKATWTPETYALDVLGASIAFLGASGLNAQAKEVHK